MTEEIDPELAADLQTQLEAFLHVVFREEENWRLDDRIDLATRGEIPKKERN